MSTRHTVTTTAAIPARRRRYDWYTALTFFGFVGPLVLGLLFFTALPIAWGFLVSLNDARGTVDVGKWIGFTNYASMLSDSAFLDSLRVVSIFAVFIIPSTFFLGLGLALLVHAVDVAGAGHRAPVAAARIHHAHLPGRLAGDPTASL